MLCWLVDLFTIFYFAGTIHIWLFNTHLKIETEWNNALTVKSAVTLSSAFWAELHANSDNLFKYSALAESYLNQFLSITSLSLCILYSASAPVPVYFSLSDLLLLWSLVLGFVGHSELECDFFTPFEPLKLKSHQLSFTHVCEICSPLLTHPWESALRDRLVV